MIRRLTILSSALVALLPWQAMAETVTLRVACFLPARSVTVTRMYEPWIKSIEAETKGAVKIQGYWGGSLGRHPAKQFELIKSGVADAAVVLPGYTPGKFPDFGMFELPYLIRSALESSFAQARMFEKGMIRGLEEVKMLGFFATEPNILHSRKPLKSLADVKELKIRSAGPVYASTIKHLGGIPIGMPVTQLTESLSRGVVDGAILGWGGALIFRLANVTSYHYETPLGTTPSFLAMNQARWDSLPANIKAVITKFSGDHVAKLGGGGFDSFSKRARGIIGKMKGERSIVTASPAEIEAQLAAAKPVHDEWIAKTDDGGAKYEALVKILADIRAGR